MQFFKIAKTVCGKQSTLGGVIFNGNEMIAVDDRFQIRLKTDETIPDNFILPIRAIEYMSSFGVGAKVDYVVKDQQCTIKSGRSHTKFALLLSQEIPELATYAEDNVIQCNKDAVNALKIANTAPVTSNDRAILQSVTLKVVDDKVVAVGTDSYKLAYVPIADAGSNRDFNAKIRKDMLSLVLSSGLFNDGDFKIALSENKRKLLFINDNTTVICPQMEYSDIDEQSMFALADKANKHFEFNKDEMLLTFKRALLLGERSTSIMTVTQTGINIKLRNGVSDFEESLPVNGNNDGEPIVLGVNTDMLIAILSCFSENELTFHHGGSKCVYYISDGNIKYLMTPVRID